jgi:hypothetical protein
LTNYFQKLSITLFVFTLAILLFGCTKEQSGAAQAIEAYIQALSNKDTAKISNVSCADWEQNALLEIDSLTGVGSKLENLACAEAGQSGADKYVSCKGFLALDYNGEAQQIDLSTRTYIARHESGEWRMCGYQ